MSIPPTRRRVSLFAAIGFLAMGAAETLADDEAPREDVLSGQRLHADVVAYCNFGEHRTATPQDAATADWLAAEMKEAGLAVEFVPFTVPQFFLDKVRLEVDGREVEAFPYWMPLATGPSPVTGKLVAYADSGVARESLRGNIVVLRIQPLPTRSAPAQLLKDAADAGATAAIAVSRSASGDLFGVGTRVPLPLPVLLVGSRYEEALTRAAAKGASASVLIVGKHDPKAQAREVVARLDRGKRLIVVSTPYSAWFAAGGERGPGVAIWLGLARWAASRKSDTSYLFVASSGHELQGAGIRHFVEEVAPKPDEVACWLHLGASIAAYDWEATPSGFKKLPRMNARRSLSANGDDLLQSVKHAFDPLGNWNPKLAETDPGELGLMFSAGYRAFGFSGGHYFFHSPNDTAECTGPELLEPVAKALAHVLESVEQEN